MEYDDYCMYVTIPELTNAREKTRGANSNKKSVKPDM